MESCGSTTFAQNLELGYFTGGQATPLPPWASFLARLGYSLGRRPSISGRRLVVGLALPIRDYAAALLGLGLICAKSSVEPAVSSNAEYFAFLRRQPNATPVRYLYNGRIYKGELDLSPNRCKEDQVTIKYLADRKRTWWRNFNASDCTAIEILADRGDLAHAQRGYGVVQSPQFVEAIVGKATAERFCFASRVDCIFIGSAGKIGAELLDRFAVRPAGRDWIAGILQDVVRAKRFFTGGQAFRSTVHPATSRESPFADLTENPPFVIFDSSAGCVKWHYEARTSTHIVLLDRSDRRFGDAATNLTTRFYQRVGDVTDLDLSTCPASIEPITFLEKA